MSARLRPPALQRLVDDLLPAVPAKVAAKDQLEPCAGYAALCGATYATWYK
jgi:hypothetical protein